MRAAAIEVNPDQARARALLDVLPPLMPKLYNYARYLMEAEDARDAVGTALEHLWRNRNKYRNVDGAIPDRWAMRVTMNKIRDEARRHRRRPMQVSLTDLDIGIEDRSELRAQLAEVHGAIRHLRREDAELIALRFGADLSNIQIAELLLTTPGAVAVAVHRAIQRLKDVINEERTNG